MIFLAKHFCSFYQTDQSDMQLLDKDEGKHVQDFRFGALLYYLLYLYIMEDSKKTNDELQNSSIFVLTYNKN